MGSAKETLASRQALIERITKETKVQVSLSLEGGPLDLLPNDSLFSKSQESEHHASQSSDAQQIWVWTGVGFLDHMLHALAKHSGWSLRVRTEGDLASMSALSPKLDIKVTQRTMRLAYMY